MAGYVFHKQRFSDKVGVGLVRFAFRFKAARERYNFKFKFDTCLIKEEQN